MNRNRYINIYHLQNMHPCNTIPETLKPMKEREQPMKYINQTSNVPGLHWKLGA